MMIFRARGARRAERRGTSSRSLASGGDAVDVI